MALALFRTESDQRINCPIRTNTQRFCLARAVHYQPAPHHPGTRQEPPALRAMAGSSTERVSSIMNRSCGGTSEFSQLVQRHLELRIAGLRQSWSLTAWVCPCEDPCCLDLFARDRRIMPQDLINRASLLRNGGNRIGQHAGSTNDRFSTLCIGIGF